MQLNCSPDTSSNEIFFSNLLKLEDLRVGVSYDPKLNPNQQNLLNAKVLLAGVGQEEGQTLTDLLLSTWIQSSSSKWWTCPIQLKHKCNTKTSNLTGDRLRTL